MPAIITDTFDYDDIVRVLDLDEAFVHHQIDALLPKYWRIVIKTKPKGLKIFAPVMFTEYWSNNASVKRWLQIRLFIRKSLEDCKIMLNFAAINIQY